MTTMTTELTRIVEGYNTEIQRMRELIEAAEAVMVAADQAAADMKRAVASYREIMIRQTKEH